MINRGADEGEAKSDVHRFVEGEGFEGNEALVMVHRDVAVDVFAKSWDKGGIGMRAGPRG